MVDNKPGRYTKNSKWSIETGAWAFVVAILWKPVGAPCFNAVKAALPLRSLRYHPIILGAAAFLVWRFTVHPLAPLWILAALFVGVGGCMIRYPDFYRSRIDPKIRGIFWGVRYRYELREKLIGCRIIKEQEDTPVPTRTLATSCTVKLTLKMIYGDSVEFYRNASDTLGPAFNALDCKPRPVRGKRVSGMTARPPFVQFEPAVKPRLIELEFLTRNPFVRPISVDLIDFYRSEALRPQQGNASGVKRDGSPHSLPRGRHRLRISATGGGKSGADRADMYADRHDIYAGLLEVWLADGKGGVEGSYMEHLYARVCYGDVSDESTEFDPWKFVEFFEDAVDIMRRRLIGLRGDDVIHTPQVGAPDLKIKIDDILVFDSVAFDADKRGSPRKRIWGAIELIGRQGRAAGVTVDANGQDANMEDLPVRRVFTDREVGWVKEAIQVDMAVGRGAYDRGMKADRIWRDQPGTFYAESEESATPEEVRYAYVSNAVIKALPAAPVSVLWHEPEPAEEVFVSLPVEAVPVPDEIPAVPKSRRLHMNSSRRPASVVHSIPFVDEPPSEPSEPDEFVVYVPPPPSTNGNGNGNGHQPERVEEKEEVLR